MNVNSENTFAVITGASKGLGRAFAKELTKKMTHLILISLPEEGLEDVARELRKQGVEVIPYTVDLSVKKELMACVEQINRNFNVKYLINNAGVGSNKHFMHTNVDALDAMIQVNVRAVTLMTRLLLPNLLRQNKAFVLNISSLAAFSPIAYKSIYPASKSFVHSFTRSMQEEFSDTSVTFSVVNPGPMKTNGDVTERIETQNFWVRALLLHPEEVARLALKRLMKGHQVIQLDGMHRFGLFLLWILPVRLKRKILSSIIKKGID